MSFLDLPVVSSILLKNKRSIEEISGYITITETTKDELEITQHPVQTGAMITDHSYVKPTVLSMQIQFDRMNTLGALAVTGASALGQFSRGVLGGIGAGVAATLVTGGFNDDIIAQTYKKLLELQQKREPFSVSTPKRTYHSMLFQSLGLVTDKNTENVLSISATFQQVIIVGVSPTDVSQANQKFKQKTAKVEQAGKKQASSSLATFADGVRPFFVRGSG